MRTREEVFQDMKVAIANHLDSYKQLVTNQNQLAYRVIENLTAAHILTLTALDNPELGESLSPIISGHLDIVSQISAS